MIPDAAFRAVMFPLVAEAGAVIERLAGSFGRLAWLRPPQPAQGGQ